MGYGDWLLLDRCNCDRGITNMPVISAASLGTVLYIECQGIREAGIGDIDSIKCMLIPFPLVIICVSSIAV